MAGRKVQVALLTTLLLLMSGCIYADTPEWGTGDGQIKVTIDSSSNTAEIQSKMGEGYSNDNVPLIECENSTIKVTGLIISSQVYSEHPLDDSIQSAMGAAVIIHKMSYSEAENFEEGTAGRVSIKDWTYPTKPSEAVGSKLSENEDDWAIVGIIPGYENIAEGLNVLEHWHQPIQITGYLADESGLNTDVDDNCKLDGQGHGMVVTNIKTAEGVVSKNGEADEEYSIGDTDFFGAWGFILFFLVAGVGGGVGLFILSTMVIRQGARATAETLLGREGFAKAIQMKKDLRKSKKEGLESASERTEKARKQSPPQKKPKKEEVSSIAGFNLDSVLSSNDSDEGPTQFGGGSSVVVTEEAKEMSNTTTTHIPTSTPMPTSNVVSSQPEPAPVTHFSATAPTRATQPTRASEPTDTKRPVKRRRAVKRSAAPQHEPEPEPEPRAPKQSSPSIADDEEFSDFSF